MDAQPEPYRIIAFAGAPEAPKGSETPESQNWDSALRRGLVSRAASQYLYQYHIKKRFAPGGMGTLSGCDL